MIQNNTGFPFLYEIVTNTGNSMLVNSNLIERVEYSPINTNWCNVFLSGFSEPMTVKMTPEEFYEDLRQSYLKIVNTK